MMCLSISKLVFTHGPHTEQASGAAGPQAHACGGEAHYTVVLLQLICYVNKPANFSGPIYLFAFVCWLKWTFRMHLGFFSLPFCFAVYVFFSMACGQHVMCNFSLNWLKCICLSAFMSKSFCVDELYQALCDPGIFVNIKPYISKI